MYARVISFSGAGATPENREKAEEMIRGTVLPMLRSYDGFAGYLALFDAENQRARAIILWDSEDAAVSAEETLADRRAGMASSIGLAIESADLYEAVVVELEGARV
jgi:hypothetical protein